MPSICSTSPSVLLLGCDEPELTWLEYALAHHGYRVHAEPSVDLDIDEAPRPDPAMVILSASPSLDDALQICRSFRDERATNTVPILMILSAKDAAVWRRCLEAGADDFITTPLDLVELGARLRSMIGQAQRHQSALSRAYWAQLLNAQRLSALVQLSGGVAHDFNNLLAITLNYADLISEELAPDSIAQEYVKAIERAANKGADMTRQLLNIGLGEPQEPGLLNLSRVLDELESALAPLLGSHIRLTITAPHAPMMIVSDRRPLEHTLLLMARTVADQIDGYAELCLDLEHMRLEEARQDAAGDPLAAGEYARLALRSERQVKPRRWLDRLWQQGEVGATADPLSDADPSTLLQLIRQSCGAHIVEPHQEGVLLELWFPSIPLEPAKPSLNAATPQRILVVEDDPDILILVEQFLTSLGYQVFAMTSPGEALRMSDEHSIDLLITDLLMPEISGAELIEALRQDFPGLPCICISGYLDTLADSLPQKQHLWTLSKPFSLAQLEQAVDHAFKLAERAPYMPPSGNRLMTS